MTSAAYDFRELLQAAEVLFDPWEVYVGREPPSPDTVITCYDSSGENPLPNLGWDWLHVQARVRGPTNDYLEAFTVAQSIKDHFLGLTDQTTDNGNVYMIFTMVGDIIALGYDENKRPLLVINWRIGRRPSSLGNRRSM